MTRRKGPIADIPTDQLRPEFARAVDAYIAERSTGAAPETLTRPEAVWRLAADALVGMGLMRP